MTQEQHEIAVNSETERSAYLPTNAQVLQNLAVFYSDHVPLLFEIPVNQNKTFKGITYNVYGARSPCGYSIQQAILNQSEVYRNLNIQFATASEKASSDDGTDADVEQAKMLRAECEELKESLLNTYHNERHQRIADALRALSEQELDIIVLQEVDSEQLNVIQNKFDNSRWGILSNNNATISLYDKTKYDASTPVSETDQPNTKASQNFILTPKNSLEQPIFITNFWGQYADISEPDINTRFDHIDELMNQHPVESNAAFMRLVVGDFNVPMAENKDNNITNKGLIFDRQAPAPYFSIDSAVYQCFGGVSIKALMKPINIQTREVGNDSPLKGTPSIHSEQGEIFYKSADDKLRERVITQIKKEISRLQEKTYFLRQDKIDSGKVAAFTALLERIESAPSGANYQAVIEDWEQSRDNHSTKKYREILHEHRLVFFSEKRWRSSALTASEEAIDSLKTSLRP